MKYILVIFILNITLVGSELYYYKNNTKTTLVKSSSVLKSSADIDYYKNENGSTLGVNNKLIVKFKNIQNLENYLNEYNIKIDKILSNNLYLFEASDKNLTINISNSLNDKEDVKYSHPDFIKKRMRR